MERLRVFQVDLPTVYSLCKKCQSRIVEASEKHDQTNIPDHHLLDHLYDSYSEVLLAYGFIQGLANLEFARKVEQGQKYSDIRFW